MHDQYLGLITLVVVDIYREGCNKQLLMLVANGASVFDASESVSDEWCRKLLVAAAAFCLGHLCPPSVTPHSYTHHQLCQYEVCVCIIYNIIVEEKVIL